jgi:arsenate reductase (thioredoxin)
MRRDINTDPYCVLFVGTGNSTRSIVAEPILNRAGQGRFRAFSGEPKGEVHPYALDLLKRLHYDVNELGPKNWKEFSRPDAPKLDFVFTVCDKAAKEIRPIWPGQPLTAHWGIPDPAQTSGSEAEVRFVFADTLRMLRNRIGIFVSLPLESLDQLAVQKRLDAIAKPKDADTKAASAT